jgi:uncharacterized membrane protein
MAKQPRARNDAPPATSKGPNPAAAGLVTDPDEDTLIERTVTVNRPRRELYAFWRDFRNLPLFMENIESVTEIEPTRSRWRVKAPANTSVEWESIITEDVPGEVIAWTSADDADIKNSGRIVFHDSTNGRGTLVTATIAYDAPGGALGKLFATLFQREPKAQARHELRRFKQLMETGEISTGASQ